MYVYLCILRMFLLCEFAYVVCVCVLVYVCLYMHIILLCVCVCICTTCVFAHFSVCMLSVCSQADFLSSDRRIVRKFINSKSSLKQPVFA